MKVHEGYELLGFKPLDHLPEVTQRRLLLARAHDFSKYFAVASMESTTTTAGVKGSFARQLTGGTNNITGAVEITKTTTWAFGTGVTQFNQPLTTTVSIAGGATNNFDLASSLTNVVGDASATLTGIKHILIELISVAQDATNGTACTGITIGNHATAAWAAPFGATGTYAIKNGGYWAHEEPTAGGVVVTQTTADLIKIVNNDGAVAAYVRISVFGLS